MLGSVCSARGLSRRSINLNLEHTKTLCARAYSNLRVTKYNMRHNLRNDDAVRQCGRTMRSNDGARRALRCAVGRCGATTQYDDDAVRCEVRRCGTTMRYDVQYEVWCDNAVQYDDAVQCDDAVHYMTL